MKKTKIAFEDIKAGDLLEAISTNHGIKTVLTGVAFEKFGRSRDEEWRTSQGGTIVAAWDLYDGDEIYRVDVVKVKFDDIRAGDKIRVTIPEFNEVDKSYTGVAGTLGSEEVWADHWVTASGHGLVYRSWGAKIEILERAGE